MLSELPLAPQLVCILSLSSVKWWSQHHDNSDENFRECALLEFGGVRFPSPTLLVLGKSGNLTSDAWDYQNVRMTQLTKLLMIMMSIADADGYNEIRCWKWVFYKKTGYGPMWPKLYPWAHFCKSCLVLWAEVKKSFSPIITKEVELQAIRLKLKILSEGRSAHMSLLLLKHSTILVCPREGILTRMSGCCNSFYQQQQKKLPKLPELQQGCM